MRFAEPRRKVSTVDKVWSRIEIKDLGFSVYLVLRFANDAPTPHPLSTDEVGRRFLTGRLVGWGGRLIER